jgi:hypothetical protein
MAGPFNPPNPYGSYYGFNEPERLTRETFGPTAGNLTPGAMALAGYASGGKMPSPIENLNAQMRNQVQQQFMAELMRSDPRVANLTGAALGMMSGRSRDAVLNVTGGRGNLQELVGYVMSQPGISGMFGGSPLAMGQGAYAATTSGMRIGGNMLMGDNAWGMSGAQQLVQHMRSQFYSGGSLNRNMTYGMGEDKLGGVMMLGAAQGAFAGMNLGSIVPQKGGFGLATDKTTMDKITTFAKNALKSLSELADVYGDGSTLELAAKATQITGLNFSQAGNPALIAQRLASLRNTGAAMGVDTQTMYDLSAYGTTMGRRLGMSSEYSGFVATTAANQVAGLARINQAQAGSFRTSVSSLQEMESASIRDQAAMMRDPVGRRRAALQYGLQSGFFSGAEGAVKDLMQQDGVAGMKNMDAFMRSRGINTEGFLRFAGGPDSLSGLLNEDSMSELSSANQSTVRSRARARLRSEGRRAMPGLDSESSDKLLTLIESIDRRTLDEAFSQGADVSATLAKDPEGANNLEKYAGLVNQLQGALGMSGAATAFKGMSVGLAASPFYQNFATLSAERSMGYAKSTGIDFSDVSHMRGRKGMMQAFLERSGGRDPRSNYIRALMEKPGEALGGLGGFYVPKPGETIDVGALQDTYDTLGRAFKAGTPQSAAMGLNQTNWDRQAFAGMLWADDTYKNTNKLGGYTFGSMGSYRTGVRTSTLEHLSKWGDTANLARRMSEIKGLDTGTVRSLNSVATALTEGGDDRRMSMAYNSLLRTSSDLDLLSKIDNAGLLGSFAGASLPWASSQASYLRELDQSGKYDQDPETRAKIKGLREKLDPFDTSGDGPKAFVLQGQFDLVNNALRLVEGAKLTQSRMSK